MDEIEGTHEDRIRELTPEHLRGSRAAAETYRQAYSLGHAGGDHEIEYHYAELIDIAIAAYEEFAR